jgi:hypothetical protein
MKKIISSVLILSCAGVALLYFNTNEKIEVKAESSSAMNLATTSLKTSTTVSQKNTTKISKSKMIVDLAQADVISSFAQLLAGMAPHEQAQYITLNKQLFGALDFSDNKSYQVFLAQGFPSLNDIDYVAQYTRQELANMLFNNVSADPNYTKDPSLNLPVISAVNLLETIAELENVVWFYFPNYQQGDPLPVESEWPNGERPAQVMEKLVQIIGPTSALMNNTAIEHLAQARYAQLSLSRANGNVVAVLTNLAIADKKLGGNSNITNYVKQNYPEHIETYANLRNDL